jgi:hypothetical protein
VAGATHDDDAAFNVICISTEGVVLQAMSVSVIRDRTHGLCTDVS